MTAAAALYKFFSSAVSVDGAFWDAYPEDAVPSKAAGYDHDAAFPYLTYSLATSSLDAGEVSLSVNLWHKTQSEKRMNAAASALSDAIGRGGVTIPCDGGTLWLKRGTPFAQAMPDEDVTIKRRYINVVCEYLTKN